jgi:glycosyltransferase involved in cell wall biosynthesis
VPLLVSCVLPTCNRARLIPRAIHSYQSQTYPHRELIVLDNGCDGTERLIPSQPDITYRRIIGHRTTGEMRNLCAERAQGEIICHFDSDDWSAPERVADQVERLAQSDGVLTGYKSMLFYDERVGQVYQWAWYNGPPFALGTSLCYTKLFWMAYKFLHIRVGEDFRFTQTALRQFPGRVTTVHGQQMMVALLHDQQTSFKNLASPNYQKAGLQVLPQAFKEWLN